MDTSEVLETRRKKNEALEATVASATRSRDEAVDAVRLTSTAASEAIAEREQLATRYKDAQKGKATSEVIDRIEAAIVDVDCKVVATTNEYDQAAAALAEAEQATITAEGAVADSEGL